MAWKPTKIRYGGQSYRGSIKGDRIEMPLGAHVKQGHKVRVLRERTDRRVGRVDRMGSRVQFNAARIAEAKTAEQEEPSANDKPAPQRSRPRGRRN